VHDFITVTSGITAVFQITCFQMLIFLFLFYSSLSEESPTEDAEDEKPSSSKVVLVTLLRASTVN